MCASCSRSFRSIHTTPLANATIDVSCDALLLHSALFLQCIFILQCRRRTTAGKWHTSWTLNWHAMSLHCCVIVFCCGYARVTYVHFIFASTLFIMPTTRTRRMEAVLLNDRIQRKKANRSFKCQSDVCIVVSFCFIFAMSEWCLHCQNDVFLHPHGEAVCRCWWTTAKNDTHRQHPIESLHCCFFLFCCNA